MDIDPAYLIPKLRTETDRASVLKQVPYYRWLVGELHHFLERIRPAAIFLWNGSGLAAMIAEQLARRRGISVVSGPCDYIPKRSYPLLQAREVLRLLAEEGIEVSSITSSNVSVLRPFSFGTAPAWPR